MLRGLEAALTWVAEYFLFLPWVVLNAAMFAVGATGDESPLFGRLGTLALVVAIGVVLRVRPQLGSQILIPLALIAFAVSVLGSMAGTGDHPTLFGFAMPEWLRSYFLFLPIAVFALEGVFAMVRPEQGGALIFVTALLMMIAMITRLQVALWVAGPALVVGALLLAGAWLAKSRPATPALSPR